LLQWSNVRATRRHRFKRDRSSVQLSGRNGRNDSMTGTAPRANVSDTKVWQLAILPSVEQYCGATPTECLPFLSMVVSSMTSTASRPPTSLLNYPDCQGLIIPMMY
jgi:hypothetical protein